MVLLILFDGTLGKAGEWLSRPRTRIKNSGASGMVSSPETPRATLGTGQQIPLLLPYYRYIVPGRVKIQPPHPVSVVLTKP
jgi:hypothetical protein